MKKIKTGSLWTVVSGISYDGVQARRYDRILRNEFTFLDKLRSGIYDYLKIPNKSVIVVIGRFSANELIIFYNSQILTLAEIYFYKGNGLREVQ